MKEKREGRSNVVVAVRSLHFALIRASRVGICIALFRPSPTYKTAVADKQGNLDFLPFRLGRQSMT